MKFKTLTVEDAFAATGREITKLPDVSTLPEKDQKFIIADYKLKIVAEAINQEANGGKPWKPDWSNRDWKYYPWFDLIADDNKVSGFGLSYDGYARTITNTSVGSRLCYITEEAAQYAGTQFAELYEEAYLIPK